MMMTMRSPGRQVLPVAAALASCLTLWASPARSQVLLNRFEPAERGSRFFVADSLELASPEHGRDFRFAAGVVMTYGNRLRTFRQASEPEASTLVEHAVWLHPGASLVMAPGARFGLEVPIALQTGESATLDGAFHGAPGSPRLGDVRGSFDLRLAGRSRSDADGALLAAGLSVYLPTGSASDYTSDDHARVALRVATSVQLGSLLASARVGYMYRRDEIGRFAGVPTGSEANAVLGVGYQRRGLVIGPELHGATALGDPFQRRSTPLEVLAGAHVTFGELRAGAGVGGLLVSGLGSAQLRTVLSVEWTPGPSTPSDRDRDGVPDLDDACPDVSGPVAAAGCPPPPTDRDGDGIFDADDACPDLPGARSRDSMIHGCPDTDHDGVPDPVDACPNVSGERSVLPRFSGCPADMDGDGVPDSQDACLDVPGVATTDLATTGCPPPPPPPPEGAGD